MKQNIKELGVDFPIIKAQVSLFEKGTKIISQKLGSSIILFTEVNHSKSGNRRSKKCNFSKKTRCRSCFCI